jgi:Zinc knuckle
MGVTPEMLMAMNGQDQIETPNLICYNCGQFGHRSEGCTNAKNFDLAAQVLRSQGHNPCEGCRRFGHQPATCWSMPQNAHLRPPYWKVLDMNNWKAHNNFQEVNIWRAQEHVQDSHNMVDPRSLPDGHTWQQPTQAQEGNIVVNGQQERGNMSIDNEHKECEWSLMVGH